MEAHLARIARVNPEDQRHRHPRRRPRDGRTRARPTSIRRTGGGCWVPCTGCRVETMKILINPRRGPHDLRLAPVSATTCPPSTRYSSSACVTPARSTLGKTNTPEFGAGSNTFNPVFGSDGQSVRPEGRRSVGAAAARRRRCRLRDGADRRVAATWAARCAIRRASSMASSGCVRRPE